MAASSGKGGRAGKGGGGRGGSAGSKPKAASNPLFLLVIGLPGSGKSTICDALKKKGWVVISQDELGSREECEKAFDKACKKSAPIALDRVNVHAKERRMWITRAKNNGITDIQVIMLNTDPEVCKQRILSRKDHPTLSAREDFDPCTVIDRFATGIQFPDTREGYSQVYLASNEEEVAAHLKTLLAKSPATKTR